MFQCTLLANSFSIDESTRKNDVRISKNCYGGLSEEERKKISTFIPVHPTIRSRTKRRIGAHLW